MVTLVVVVVAASLGILLEGVADEKHHVLLSEGGEGCASNANSPHDLNADKAHDAATLYERRRGGGKLLLLLR